MTLLVELSRGTGVFEMNNHTQVALVLTYLSLVVRTQNNHN